MDANLMPCDCMEILKKHYGKRLDRIKPKTLIKWVRLLMGTQIADVDNINNEIIEAVNIFLNDF